MGNSDFRRRCEAALTHPATLIALAALLVNDVVLKALFPGAWAMGKLSDLAWMAFAPPLLAFLLSFIVPKSAAGRRAALIIAYGGLPLLYAAFNTFVPVHDAIMRALLIGAESGAVGSPMDATDSLVIPFGVALAVWAWRRSAESAGGTRWRFGLLVAGVAAFAAVASSVAERAEGVGNLSATEDGTLIATSIPNFRVYTSDDGGMSWSRDDSGAYDIYRDSIVYASQSVETPRGEYSITGSGVERAGEGGGRELVHSTRYLRGDANKWVQENATRGRGYRLLATRPNSIIYHAESGNIIAAMGIQGAVVGTPDGRWRRVAVGRYSPTDFSLSGKTRALMGQAWGVGAVALALSLSAMVVSALASAYDRYNNERDIGFVGATAFFCLLAFGALMIGALNYDVFGVYLIVSLAAVLTSWIAANRAASKSEDGAGWRFAALSCAVALTLAAMTLFSFGFSDNNTDLISVTVAVTAFAAFIALVPPLAYYGRFIARRWRAFALAFAGMNALIILSFALWLTLNLGLIAAQVAIAVLVGLAAVVLVRHVRGADAGGWR